MTSTTPRRAAAAVLAGAAILALPAATASAATEPAARHADGQRLLGGLLGGSNGTNGTAVSPSVVDGLVGQLATVGTTLGLNTSQLTQTVNGLLAGGVAPDASVVGNLLTTALGTVADAGKVDDLVTGLLGSGVLPADVVGVVEQVLGTVSPSADLTSVVDGVVGQLLAAGLPTDAAALDGLVTALTAGQLPTGALLDPLAHILDTLAANTALPAELRATIGALAANVRSAGTARLGDDLLGTVSGLLDSLVRTADLNRPVADALGTLAGLLVKPQSVAPGTTPPATTPPGTSSPSGGPSARRSLAITSAMRARVKRVRIDQGRKKVKATLSCPAAAVFGCAVSARLRISGHAVGKTATAIMRPGTTRTVTLKVPASSVRRLLRRGGTVGVRATSALGRINPSASRSITVRKTARR